MRKYTGLTDKNGTKIHEGDVTELQLPDGTIRRFLVIIKTVDRENVSHPSFDTKTAKVRITGVVFVWNGFDLFPCIDENGISDEKKMVVIGDAVNNPELMSRWLKGQ